MAFIKSVTFIAAILLGTVQAASPVYSIDPNSVDLTIRTGWCNSQTSICPLLCTQINPGGSTTTAANTCDPNDLTYSCECENGKIPDTANYTMTLPYFVCTQASQNCINGCNAVATCQAACQTNYICGASNPSRVNITSRTSSSSTIRATATSAGTVFSGAATTGATSGIQNGAPSTIDVNKSLRMVTIGASFVAGFLLIL